MPKSPEELEKMFSELSTRQSSFEKESNQKIEMAERNAKEYKDLADKNAEELRKFKQDAEAREKESKVALEKKFESEISEFIEAQVKAGRFIPALKERIKTFMKSLTSEGEVLKFTEANGAVLSHTQLSLFKELILKLKPIMSVETEYSVAEVASAAAPDDAGGDAPAAPQKHFAEITVGGEKKRIEVDEVDIAAKAFQFQEAQAKLGRSVSYEDALIAVYPKKKSSVSKA